VLGCVVAAAGAAQAAPARSVDARAAVAAVVQKTNAFRAAHELGAVAPEARLAETAQRFAEYMAASDTYGHEADGRKPAQRAQAQGYEFCLVAENIAYQYSSSGFSTGDLADHLVAGWEDSPGHRRNLLLPQAVDIGVGLARSARTGRWYAVQVFGRPKGAASRFQIANRGDASVSYELDSEAFTLPPRGTRTHHGCFGGTVRLRWPDGAASPGFEPRDGARYVVERGPAGRWRVHTQMP
jgi:uncharacterized protein YkwD